MKGSIQIFSTSKKAIKPVFLLLLLFIGLNGCRVINPKTTALKQVHETYRDEFQSAIQLSIGQPQNQASLPKAIQGQFIFTKTLKSIRDFQAKYPSKTDLNAHLNVLQGMIYLQSGEIGMAKSVMNSVTDPSNIDALKSKKDGFIRDQLFAKSFKDLLAGWKEIETQLNAESSGDNASGADRDKLKTAADNIVNRLNSKEFNNVTSSDIDEGAIYLAITASIFYLWEISLNINESKDDKCSKYKNSIELIEKHLSTQEKEASKGDITSTVGRSRYINWHKFIKSQILISGCN
ncbi:hypothetical protein GCM10028808_46980 [Spirosoma migulaei]